MIWTSRGRGREWLFGDSCSLWFGVPQQQKADGCAPLLLILVSLAACTEQGPAPLSEAEKRGQHAFAVQCAPCHRIDGTGGYAGPPLAGIIGRTAGTGAFAYSDAMKKSGITWTPATLEWFLAAPREAVPDNQMAFFGIHDAQVRADLVTYIVATSGR